MKSILSFLTLFIIFSSSVFSQAPFIGPKYTKTTTWLFSKYVSAQGETQDYGITGGQNYGLFVGYDLNEDIGVQLEFLLNTHSQNYTGTVIGTKYDSRVDLKSFDIPLMIKLGQPVYFEMGPVFSFISKAEYSYETSFFDDDFSVKDDFKKSNLQLAFGFGGDITIADNLFINMGMRIAAGVSDLGGVDAYGRNIDDLQIMLDSDAKDLKTYSVSGGIHIGVKYKFN